MISVVVAVYNGEKYILEQLNSLKNQTLPAQEVYILDDGSTDNSIEIIKKFIDENALSWILLQNEKNLGYSGNFYKGISMVRGDVIFLCDQDDIWDAKKIETMSRIILEDSEIKLLYSAVKVIDGNGNKTKNNLRFAYEDNDGSIIKQSFKDFLGCSRVRGCTMCFRSELKDKAENVTLDHLMSHDWYYTMIASSLGSVGYLKKQLVGYRVHENNASLHSGANPLKKRILGLREEARAYEKLIKSDLPFTKREISAMQHEKRCCLKRTKYLNKGGFFRFLRLACFFKCYSHIYNSFSGGIRVWLGDFSYRQKGRKEL